MYVIEYQDHHDRWHRARANWTNAADAVAEADVTYAYGWRILDRDGNKIADHLGRGTRSTLNERTPS